MLQNLETACYELNRILQPLWQQNFGVSPSLCDIKARNGIGGRDLSICQVYQLPHVMGVRYWRNGHKQDEPVLILMIILENLIHLPSGIWNLPGGYMNDFKASLSGTIHNQVETSSDDKWDKTSLLHNFNTQRYINEWLDKHKQACPKKVCDNQCFIKLQINTNIDQNYEWEYNSNEIDPDILKYNEYGNNTFDANAKAHQQRSIIKDEATNEYYMSTQTYSTNYSRLLHDNSLDKIIHKSIEKCQYYLKYVYKNWLLMKGNNEKEPQMNFQYKPHDSCHELDTIAKETEQKTLSSHETSNDEDLTSDETSDDEDLTSEECSDDECIDDMSILIDPIPKKMKSSKFKYKKIIKSTNIKQIYDFNPESQELLMRFNDDQVAWVPVNKVEESLDKKMKIKLKKIQKKQNKKSKTVFVVDLSVEFYDYIKRWKFYEIRYQSHISTIYGCLADAGFQWSDYPQKWFDSIDNNDDHIKEMDENLHNMVMECSNLVAYVMQYLQLGVGHNYIEELNHTERLSVLDKSVLDHPSQFINIKLYKLSQSSDKIKLFRCLSTLNTNIYQGHGSKLAMHRDWKYLFGIVLAMRPNAGTLYFGNLMPGNEHYSNALGIIYQPWSCLFMGGKYFCFYLCLFALMLLIVFCSSDRICRIFCIHSKTFNW